MHRSSVTPTKSLAILGATGNIGKALAFNLSVRNDIKTHLFARSPEKIRGFLSKIEGENKFEIHHLKDFNSYHYDIVVNCIGLGNPSNLKVAGQEIFRITEKFDDLILEYLKKNYHTTYISISSGAVYGKTFKDPVNNQSGSVLNINNLGPEDYYGIAKINSEAKHRSFPDLNIVDLRVFSFFSRFIDLNSGFFMSEIINCIKDNKPLTTTPDDFMRDYVHPKDLLNLILLCAERKGLNDFFDVYSLKPVSKIELLNFFQKQYGLKYNNKLVPELSSPTGLKPSYYSKSRKAKVLGYVPNHSSLDGIKNEVQFLLHSHEI